MSEIQEAEMEQIDNMTIYMAKKRMKNGKLERKTELSSKDQSEKISI